VQPDAHAQWDAVPCLHALHRGDDGEPGAHDPLGVVLVRLGVAEESDQTVAEILSDVSLETGDGVRSDAAIPGGEIAPLFGIDLGCDLRRSDQIAEENRQLATLALGSGGRRRCESGCRRGPLDPRAALQTELRSGPEGGSALHAAHRDRDAALETESRLEGVVVSATRTRDARRARHPQRTLSKGPVTSQCNAWAWQRK